MNQFLNMSLIFLSLSCASWRLGETTPIDDFPTTMAKKLNRPVISVKLSKYDLFENAKLKKGDNKEITKKIISTFHKTSLFDLVDDDSPSKELSVDIKIIRNKESSLALSIFSYATLCLIPKRDKEMMTVNTSFYNKKGELIAMIEKTETVVTWYQTLLIIATPFMLPSRTQDNAMMDLIKSTILEGYRDGHFFTKL